MPPTAHLRPAPPHASAVPRLAVSLGVVDVEPSHGEGDVAGGRSLTQVRPAFGHWSVPTPSPGTPDDLDPSALSAQPSRRPSHSPAVLGISGRSSAQTQTPPHLRPPLPGSPGFDTARSSTAPRHRDLLSVVDSVLDSRPASRGQHLGVPLTPYSHGLADPSPRTIVCVAYEPPPAAGQLQPHQLSDGVHGPGTCTIAENPAEAEDTPLAAVGRVNTQVSTTAEMTESASNSATSSATATPTTDRGRRIAASGSGPLLDSALQIRSSGPW